MSDDAKVSMAMAVVFVLAVATITVGFVWDNRTDAEAFKACVAAGKTPGDCGYAVYGRPR